MLRKIKTGINSDSSINIEENKQKNNNDNLSYNLEDNSVVVENFDLSSYTTNNSSQNANITEQVALNAINENLNNNRAMTDNMNEQIYNAFIEKINQYIVNSGRKI